MPPQPTTNNNQGKAPVSDVGMLNMFAEMVNPAQQNADQVNAMRAQAVLAAAQHGATTVPVPASPGGGDYENDDDNDFMHAASDHLSRRTSDDDDDFDTEVSRNAAADILAAAAKPVDGRGRHDRHHRHRNSGSSSRSSRSSRSSHSSRSSRGSDSRSPHQPPPLPGATQQPQQPQQRQQQQQQQQQSGRRQRRAHGNARDTARDRRNNNNNTRDTARDRRNNEQGFRDALEAMLANYRNPAGNNGPGALKVARQFVCDPDEAERRDLWMQLEELRLSTGMHIPISQDAPTATLQYTLQRYTEMMSRNNDITLVIDAIQRIAQLVEAVNTSLGPYLPLHGYSAHVQRVSQQSQFRYAVYRMLLKYRGASTFSPVREIALALLMPVFSAIVSAIINYVRRSNNALDGVAGQMQDAAQSVATFVVGTNPPPHIPSNVPDAVFADGVRPMPPAVFARGGGADIPLMTMPTVQPDDADAAAADDAEIDRQLDEMTGGNYDDGDDDANGVDVIAPVT